MQDFFNLVSKKFHKEAFKKIGYVSEFINPNTNKLEVKFRFLGIFVDSNILMIAEITLEKDSSGKWSYCKKTIEDWEDFSFCIYAPFRHTVYKILSGFEIISMAARYVIKILNGKKYKYKDYKTAFLNLPLDKLNSFRNPKFYDKKVVKIKNLEKKFQDFKEISEKARDLFNKDYFLEEVDYSYVPFGE